MCVSGIDMAHILKIHTHSRNTHTDTNKSLVSDEIIYTTMATESILPIHIKVAQKIMRFINSICYNLLYLVFIVGVKLT
jgi:hypothetical protein